MSSNGENGSRNGEVGPDTALGKVLGKPALLKGLVSYEKDSVVSKTIVDTDSGTITLFSFDAYQGLSEHTAPYNAVIYIFDGEAEVKIGRESFAVKNGEMAVLPANVPHSLKAKGRFKMMLTMIRA
jgi:quercetin dioxygenase-like cupin family protein